MSALPLSSTGGPPPCWRGTGTASNQEWRDRAAAFFERAMRSWGICLASEWLIDPTLALASAEELGFGCPQAPRKGTPRLGAPRSTFMRRALSALIALALCVAVCALAPPTAAGQGPLALVQNPGDRTVTVLDAATGRAASAALPAGEQRTDSGSTNRLRAAGGTGVS